MTVKLTTVEPAGTFVQAAEVIVNCPFVLRLVVVGVVMSVGFVETTTL